MATINYKDPKTGKMVKVGVPMHDYYKKQEQLSDSVKAALGLDNNATPTDAFGVLINRSGGSEDGDGFIETDPTVPAWAKAETKPSYTASEVGALALAADGSATMTGNLNIIKESFPYVSLKDTTQNRIGQLFYNENQEVVLENTDVTGKNRSLLFLRDEDNVENLLQLSRVNNREWTNYNVYHSGNKPTARDVGSIKLYKSLTELGLTEETATPEAIVNAMDDFSMLLYSMTASAKTSALAAPIAYGLLTVTKLSAGYCEFSLREIQPYNVVGYHGYYNSGATPVWSGWVKSLSESRATDISDQNLITAVAGKSGFYKGSNITNAPSSDWWYLFVAGGDSITTVIAKDMNTGDIRWTSFGHTATTINWSNDYRPYISNVNVLEWALTKTSSEKAICGADVTGMPFDNGYWFIDLEYAPNGVWYRLSITNILTSQKYENLCNNGKWTGWKQIAFVDNTVNPNMLRNWYFGDPVDQRGGYVVPPGATHYASIALDDAQATNAYYTFTKVNNDYGHITVNGVQRVVLTGNTVRGYCSAGYTIDGWGNGENTCVLNNGCVKLISSVWYSHFWQRISAEILSALIGKQVTLSVVARCSASNQFKISLFNSTDNWSTDTEAFFTGSGGWRCYSATFTVPETFANDDVRVLLYGCTNYDFSIDKYSEVLAVKLELGSVQTLAHQDANGNWVLNEIPDKSEELLKCCMSTADTADDYANNNKTAEAFGALPDTGRVQISGNILEWAEAQTRSVTVYTNNSMTGLPGDFDGKGIYWLCELKIAASNAWKFLELTPASTGTPFFTARNRHVNGVWTGWEYDYSTAWKPTANDLGVISKGNGVKMLNIVNDKTGINGQGSCMWRTTNSTWDGILPKTYAFYARLMSYLNGSYDLWLCCNDNNGIYFTFTVDGALPASAASWKKLTTTETALLRDGTNSMTGALNFEGSGERHGQVFQYGDNTYLRNMKSNSEYHELVFDTSKPAVMYQQITGGKVALSAELLHAGNTPWHASDASQALLNLTNRGTQNGDFNDRKMPGTYWVQLAQCTNTPYADDKKSGNFGFLEVTCPFGLVTDGVLQTFTNYFNLDKWVRSYMNNTWSGWYQLATSGASSFKLNNGQSSGFVELAEDTEGGTVRIAGRGGTYIHEIDSYEDRILRIHNACKHPDGVAFHSLQWYADTGSLYVDGDITGSQVHGAVWNDYAEYREADTLEPGRVVCENGDDTLSLSTERLQPGANIVSDTFGFSIGETESAKTPIAVSGRVLAYPYEDRDSYKPGDAVCAAPNGTVSKMTEDEIMRYPHRIIGTVSAVPTYETWGTGNVPVNGRIWIKVK